MAVNNVKLSKILFLTIIVLFAVILLVYFIAGRDTITYPVPEEEIVTDELEEEVVAKEESEDDSSLIDISIDEDIDTVIDSTPEEEIVTEEPRETEEPEEEETESYDFITASDIDADISIAEGADFEEAVSKLDTPEKLIVYLDKNFIFEKGMAQEPLYPEEFFSKKKGNSWDFALFSSYVLRRHGYETGIIRYKYSATIRAVATFGGKVAPSVIILSDSGIGMYEYGFYTSEMIAKEEQRLNVKITEYSLSYWTDAGDLWPESWIKN